MLLEHAKVNTSEEDVARSLEESYTKDCIKNFIDIVLWSGYVRVLEWGIYIRTVDLQTGEITK